MFECLNVELFKYSNVPMFQCSNVPMFKCSNVQIFKFSSVQMFKFSNVKCSLFKCQISNVKSQSGKLLSKHNSGVPPVNFHIGCLGL